MRTVVTSTHMVIETSCGEDQGQSLRGRYTSKQTKALSPSLLQAVAAWMGTSLGPVSVLPACVRLTQPTGYEHSLFLQYTMCGSALERTIKCCSTPSCLSNDTKVSGLGSHFSLGNAPCCPFHSLDFMSLRRCRATTGLGDVST